MTNVKLFATDVDGTMTDACMYYAENGLELKKFNFRDGMGFKLLREAGIKTAIITSENTSIVKKRADKLKVDYLSMGTWTKLDFVKNICKELNITLDEVAYIGDDINDIELLSAVKYKACPNDAVKKIKEIEGIKILEHRGGDGAVREFIEIILGENNV
jgi:YrbI family 3-deoxy-D-manno-octulosonate 8-phosphate phosphatase